MTVRDRRGHLAAVARSTCCILLVLFLLGVSLGFAEPRYPEPTGNINDYVGVLSRSDIANLNALVDAVLRQTGVTLAVAIVENHGDETLEVYSAKLYEKWGIGKKNEDKGLLVVVSMEEHDLRMEVGYGLEPVITDSRAGECLDKMLPYFKNGEFGKGLYAGLYHAAQYIAEDAGVKLDIKAASPEYESFLARPVIPFIWQWLLAVIGLALFAGIFAAVRGVRCPRCKSRLSVVDRVIREASYSVGGIAVRVYQCPVCGYRREKTYRTHPLVKPPGGGLPPMGGPGPFFGGGFGGKPGGGGFSGPQGFGGGRSGGGGASRKW
ncbi:MAG: TPM domain-containing protein [Candidatus Fermentithermobacillus carboniphilus]|uniref:TPM domain-containing protein n=1 Tax=Candidatus Fermentithermobacillus carboniphilus TaxID=3085328 RepID=A0AAT9LFZ2_9FIRM|nr:MAG: TPM domain-containing protein [Candidatus Fermentithermobacillus carboniphilus]